MNQSELIAKIADRGAMDKTRAKQAVEAVLGAVCDALKAGEKVSLSGLGVFDISDRKARQGRNPATGQTLAIAASKAIKFRPTRSLKDAVSPPRPSKVKPAPKATAAKAAQRKTAPVKA